uniref:Immunoglobulin domain-containing protein n=1 Tax=Lates calcarifer TaxID=8187 RepID=A0A4W6BMY9_LATCA
MEPISIVCAVFLFFSCHLQGSSALTPVFVQKGKDVLLEAMVADVPEDFDLLSWTFNKSDTLVTFSPVREPRVYDAYTGKVEPSVKNYSVKLKNLQEADSGVYTARLTRDREQTVAEYNVTVQDPVAPVELTVNSVSNSSDSCNLTVTCSTQDSHHISSTLTCDTKTCSQEGGERSKVTTSGASLLVYLVNDSIICNHSNRVSWTKDSKMIGEFCPRHAGQRTERYHVLPLVIGTVVAVIIIIAAVIVYHQKKMKKRKYETEKIENTVYAVPEVSFF